MHIPRIDSQGYVYVDGAKVCRIDREKQMVVFHDGHKTRAQQRGTTEVCIEIQVLQKLCDPTRQAE